MNDGRNRGKPEQQQQYHDYAQQERTTQEEAAVAARRQTSRDSYQSLMSNLAAARTNQIRQAAHLRNLERDKAEAALKAHAWSLHNGTLASFEQDWPSTHALLLADASKRQHAINRAHGPYSLSEAGLMPHRLQSAGTAGMAAPDTWRAMTRGAETSPNL